MNEKQRAALIHEIGLWDRFDIVAVSEDGDRVTLFDHETGETHVVGDANDWTMLLGRLGRRS